MMMMDDNNNNNNNNKLAYVCVRVLPGPCGQTHVFCVYESGWVVLGLAYGSDRLLRHFGN
jgi:hypothetical protein